MTTGKDFFMRRAYFGLFMLCTAGCKETMGPTTGAVGVLVTTVGAPADIDPDGYSVSVDGGPSQAVGANGTVAFPDVEPGAHTVRLDGLAPNCSVSGQNPRTVNVVGGSSGINVSFPVVCAPRVGSLQISFITTGVQLSGSGYSVYVQGAGYNRVIGVPTNGPLTIPGIRVGAYEVRSGPLLAACDGVGPEPQRAIVQAETVTAVIFNVVCREPTQIAFVRGIGGDADIYVTNSDGTGQVQLTALAGLDVDPAWSPDGRRLAFTSDRDGNRDIYVMNADGTGVTRLTRVGASDYHPAWSPDGRRIAFVSERDGNPEIYTMEADGTGPARVTTNAGDDLFPDWSPDGTRIAFAARPQGGSPGITTIKPDGSDPVRLTSAATGADADTQPVWSPNGARIAFARAKSVYSILANGQGSLELLIQIEATDPSWSPDGRKIAFVGGDDYYSQTSLEVMGIDGTAYHTLASNSQALGKISSPAWRRR